MACWHIVALAYHHRKRQGRILLCVRFDKNSSPVLMAIEKAVAGYGYCEETSSCQWKDLLFPERRNNVRVIGADRNDPFYALPVIQNLDCSCRLFVVPNYYKEFVGKYAPASLDLNGHAELSVRMIPIIGLQRDNLARYAGHLALKAIM